MLNTASQAVGNFRLRMNQTAATLSKHPVIMATDDASPSLGPLLITEKKLSVSLT